jgi:hypothetical protein
MAMPMKRELEDLSQKIDYNSATVTYYGYASPGTLTTAAAWRIVKETMDSQGRTISIEYAGGASERNQIWDNRASLSYS